MRKIALLSNLLSIVFFLGFLTYTLVAKKHVESLAREFVTEKTIEHSKPLVDLAEKTLESKLATALLSDAKEAEIRGEITQYRDDPNAYVSDLASKYDRVVDNDTMKGESGTLSQAIANVKNRIRKFYDETLSALIDDLRIFAIANLIASVIALGLLYKSDEKLEKPLVGLSVVILFSVIFSSYLYVNDLTFFRIMFRLHLGWNYALFLTFMVIVTIIQVIYQSCVNRLAVEASCEDEKVEDEKVE